MSLSVAYAETAPAVASAGIEVERALRERLAAVARTHGFTGAVYTHFGHDLDGVLAASSSPAPRRLAATGAFDEARYLSRGYLRHDPFAGQAGAGLAPFVWRLAAFDQGDAARIRVLGVFGAWGMRAGVGVPVQDYALGPALLNLFTDDDDPVKLEANHGLFMLEAVRIHLMARTLPVGGAEAAQLSRLSAREMQVLRLAAVGRTEQETAQTLALSRRGVQFHLARAVEKLAAPNKTAAVAKAVGAGLIQI